MSKSAFFNIVYDGPALQNNEMDIKELAPALLAISEAINEANSIFNKGMAEVSVSVKGSFKTGCFGIDLHVTQDLAKSLLSLFNSDAVTGGINLITLIGFGSYTAKTATVSLLDALRWLRNRKITRITTEGGMARIHVDEEFIEVEKEIIELLRSYKLRKAIESAIVTPLTLPGIESFASAPELQRDGGEKAIIITKEEINCFIAPEPDDEEISDTTYEINLHLLSVAFQEKNKWRFSDGSSTFFAEIMDEDFAGKVQNNTVAFAKNDILRVLLRAKQTLTAAGIRTDYAVVKVLDHRHSARQLSLPFA